MFRSPPSPPPTVASTARTHARTTHARTHTHTHTQSYDNSESQTLQGMIQPRIRRSSCRMMSDYYPTWLHSHSTLAHYTPLERLDVFSVCIAAELIVAPTKSGNPAYPILNTPPHRARHDHTNPVSTPGLLFILNVFIHTNCLPLFARFRTAVFSAKTSYISRGMYCLHLQGTNTRDNTSRDAGAFTVNYEGLALHVVSKQVQSW